MDLCHAAVKNVSTDQLEKFLKYFYKRLKDNGLDITISCNLTILNFLTLALI